MTRLSMMCFCTTGVSSATTGQRRPEALSHRHVVPLVVDRAGRGSAVWFVVPRWIVELVHEPGSVTAS